MREEMLYSKSISMRDNITFHKIPEQHGENTKEVVKNFLQAEMNLPNDTICNIQILRSHRVGKPGSGSRPIIAQFDPTSTDLIMKNANKLKGKPFGVSIQLPKELEERRKRLLPTAKQAKQDGKQVKWSKDKLFIDGTQHKVHHDRVRDINVDTFDVTPITEKGSFFRGSKITIATTDDIIPGLHAIYRDTRVASATHNIYAYRLATSNGILEHYEDDGEFGAGHHVLQLLKAQNIENRLVCVSRWYGGTHLGPSRFELIKKAAEQVLSM